MSELTTRHLESVNRPAIALAIGGLTIPDLLAHDLDNESESRESIIRRRERYFLRGWFRLAKFGLLSEADATEYMVDIRLSADSGAAARALANTAELRVDFPVRLYPFDIVHAGYQIVFAEEAGGRYLACSYFADWSDAIREKLVSQNNNEQFHSDGAEYFGAHLLDD